MADAIVDIRARDDLSRASETVRRVELHASHRHVERFWGSFIRLGFGVLASEAAATLVYLRLTPSDGHRGALEAIVSVALVAAIGGVIVAGWIGNKPWRATFNFGVTLVSGLVLSVCCALDGFIDSPLVYLTILPVVSAALVLSVRRVAFCAVLAVTEVGTLALFDPDVLVSNAPLLLIFSLLIGVSGFAVLSARGRVRLQHEDDVVHQELARLAETDPLTGCLNHGAFYARLESEIHRFDRYGSALSLLLADVDLFKSFNDAHGHQAGDQALASIGAALMASARRSDIVARIGGDEFAVIFPSTSLEVAEQAAERMRRDLFRRADIDVSMSMGVATLNPDEPTAKRLVRDADAALYVAKTGGRGRVVTWAEDVTETMGRHVSAGTEVTLAEDLDLIQEQVRHVERKNAETGALMDAMLQAAPLGLCFVDKEFRALRINEILAQINGVAVEDYIGRKVSDVVAPALWQQLEPIYRSVIETGQAAVVDDVVTESPSDPGRLRYWHTTFFPTHLGDEIMGLGVVAVDVTDRRELEEADRRLLHSVVGALASAVEMRDPYTSGHQGSVALIASAIAAELGLDAKAVEDIELAARIHDLGKIRVPAEILARPGRLTDAEMAMVREHSQAGADILASVDFPEAISQMVLQHHERLDGSGYPKGASGAEIAYGAKVIAIADVVDSMASPRPYRPALGLDAALTEIRNGTGSLYDGDVVDACMRLFTSGRIRVGERSAAK